MFDRNRRAFFSLCVLIVAAAAKPGVIRAQAPAASPVTDGGLAKLDPLLRRAEAYLRSLPALELVVQQTWQQGGPAPRKGGCEFSLRSNQDGAFRLEIHSRQEPPISLCCVGDGRQITRTYDDGTHRIVSLRDGGFDDLDADQLTASCLTGSGLDILCRPRIHDHVMSRVSDVQYLGKSTLPQGESHHFRCTWDRSSRLELWISAGDDPLLLRQTRTVSTDGAADQRLSMTSDYHWSRRIAPWPGKTFEIDTAEDFVRVSDLHSYLLEGAARGMIGQAAPAMTLPDAAGKQHSLGQHADKRVVCLFFWTTWATASTQQKAEVYRLMDQFEDDTVVFYAVNVGEPKQAVVDFVKQTGFTGTVLLDVDRELAQAMRITSLPICVLVGKDGKIAAVHPGNTQEDRELVRQDLAGLIAR